MLFHTWPFLVFLLVVLPVFFLLRKTRLWTPWLLAASYFFYGWWNPYYLILVVYSTTLDYLLVALMDHCPRERIKKDDLQRGFEVVPLERGGVGVAGPTVREPTRRRVTDPVLKTAFVTSTLI